MAQQTAELIHEGRTFSVLRRQLIANCAIFEEDPALLATAYQVRSPVSDANFQRFVTTIEGSDPELTQENSPALKLL